MAPKSDPVPNEARFARRAPRADKLDRLLVEVVTTDQGDAGVGDDAAGFRGNRREHCAWPFTTSHERRHAPQRRLLLGYLPQLLARLSISQRCRDQPAELQQTVLATRRQRPLLRPGHPKDPPQATLHENWCCRCAPVAERVQLITRRARFSSEAINVRGTAGAQDTVDHAASERSPPVTDGRKERQRSDGPDHRDHAVRLQAEQRGGVELEDPLGLAGHRREHLNRSRLPRDERGNATQGRLLVGDPPKVLVNFDVVQGDGDLAGDELDGVDVFGGERAADEAVPQHKYRLQRVAAENRER